MSLIRTLNRTEWAHVQALLPDREAEALAEAQDQDCAGWK